MRFNRMGLPRREFLFGSAGLVGALTLGAEEAKAVRSRPWSFSPANPNWQRFELTTGDTIVVPAQIAGVHVRAVLDSGSGATIVNSALAKRLGISGGEARVIAGLGGKAPVRLIKDVAVSVGNETRQLPFAIEADLSVLSLARGETIDALIGADMFADVCVAIDFAQRRLAFARSGAFRPGNAWTSVPLGRGERQELFIPASIGGLEPVPLMLDLGSSTPLMLSASYVDQHNLLRGVRSSSSALGGVEGVQIVRTFTSGMIDIAGLRVRAVPTIALQRWLSVSTVGNIGLPLIAQFDVVIDVAMQRLWLREVVAAARLPMLKDRSGFGLAPGADALTVVHVAPGSPAERAGWKVSDRIIAIDARPVDGSYNKSGLWRWRYQPQGTAVALTREGGERRILILADYY